MTQPKAGIQLSTRDKNLRKKFVMTENELFRDRVNATSPASIEELMAEMNRYKPGDKRHAMLQEEYYKVLQMLEPALPEGLIAKAAATPLPAQQSEPNILDKIISIFK